MKIRSMNMWSIVLATTIVGYWVTASNAADEPTPSLGSVDSNPYSAPRPPQPPSSPAQVYIQAQQIKGQAESVAKSLISARPRTNLASNIRTAAEAVRDAKGDEAKDDAKKALSNLLGKYFDEDTKRREEELTQIEERLAKLRELLERRRSKKQDILELQMKVALNEADGLGFYDSEHSAGTKNFNPYFYSPTDLFSTPGGGEIPNAAPVKTWSYYRGKPEPKKSKSGSKSSIQPK